MNISRVFAISETFYDILFNKGKPVSACPGGAMLNSSVSLGRAGIPVSYIGEFGSDTVGKLIHEFLRENGVSTEYIYIYEGNSPLALAFLDERNDAAYNFYDDFPEKRLHIEIPDFAPDDIVMFGSILSVTKEARTMLENILSSAKNSDATVLYDPNFRPALLSMIEDIKPRICENIACSDIIRASDEDMRMIHGCENSEEAYEFVRENGCNLLIYTASSDGVYLETLLFSKYYRVPTLETVSTVGAGDNFNAGIAYMLHSERIRKPETISEESWDRIIGKAIDFASHVCMSAENYISNNFASGLKKV